MIKEIKFKDAYYPIELCDFEKHVSCDYCGTERNVFVFPANDPYCMCNICKNCIIELINNVPK